MKAKPTSEGAAKIILERILSLFGTDSNELDAEKQPRKPEINAKTYEGENRMVIILVQSDTSIPLRLNITIC